MWISWPTLELKIRHGMTVKEIAEATGVSVSTAKRRIAEEMTDAKQTYTGKKVEKVGESVSHFGGSDGRLVVETR